MNAATPPAFLRRYTDLPALLHILSNRQLTLLDPKTWDDRNDAHFMAAYKERKGLKSLLALCFSQASETYHHWRVFSSGPSGVCIVFDRERLLEDIAEAPGISVGSMRYLTMKEAKQAAFHVDELPFVKRVAYKPEREFRALYASTTEEHAALDLPIRLTTIRGISLSPWMHASLSKSTAGAIRTIAGCERLRVSRSTLVSNEQWKKLAAEAI
ncbi:MAG: hypothetical protein H6R14_1750 [Proteobacteria bacterium]|nr:hypothetical protein [Pseudomonadota bacterium]